MRFYRIIVEIEAAPPIHGPGTCISVTVDTKKERFSRKLKGREDKLPPVCRVESNIICGL